MMSRCPCCDDRLLHHIRNRSQYWFCRTCWQEMPVFPSEEAHIYLGIPQVKSAVSSRCGR